LANLFRAASSAAFKKDLVSGDADRQAGMHVIMSGTTADPFVVPDAAYDSE
jgi:hypothetical protein